MVNLKVNIPQIHHILTIQAYNRIYFINKHINS
nr:MAG TPA: hypothetical protein [Caudoviricetes sp.]